MWATSHFRTEAVPSFSLDSDQLAREYERNSATRQFTIGRHLVAKLGIAPGDRVLDLGCGTGELTEYLADLVGAAGRVVGIDPLPLRIELAHTKRRPNLSFEVGNAYNLDGLLDTSFDVVVMNGVFHWLPEKTRPLLEAARVLRPGGRIAINTRLKGYASRLQEVASKVLSEPPFDRYPQPRPTITFRVDAEEMRAFFEMTGFATTNIEVLEIDRSQPSADAAIRYSEAGSFGNFLGHLPDELKGRARTTIRQRLGRFVTADGLVQREPRLIAMAVRPN
jgi:arsenite methyltransferase